MHENASNDTQKEEFQHRCRAKIPLKDVCSFERLRRFTSLIDPTVLAEHHYSRPPHLVVPTKLDKDRLHDAANLFGALVPFLRSRGSRPCSRWLPVPSERSDNRPGAEPSDSDGESVRWEERIWKMEVRWCLVLSSGFSLIIDRKNHTK